MLSGRGRGRGSRQAQVQEARAVAEETEPSDDEDKQGAGGGPGDPEVSNSGHEPTLADLVGILHTHMAEQKQQEAQRSREASQQWKTIKELQDQFSHFSQTLQDQSTATSGEHQEAQLRSKAEPARRKLGSKQPQPGLREAYPEESHQFDDDEDDEDGHSLRPYGVHHRSDRFSRYHPKLQKLTEEDDIEHFLITFERIAKACRWPRADWSFHLIPLLTGKARGAYVHMDVGDSEDYNKVKAAILMKYDVTSESYRLKFRCQDVIPGESPKELYVRLKELYQKWITPEDKTVEEVSEAIILEQYLRMVSPELQVWLKEHDPQSALEAATLATTYVSARRKDQPWSYVSWKTNRDARRPNTYQHSQRPPVNVSKPSVKDFSNKPFNKDFSSGPSRRPPICYLCGQEGHTKPVCPKNPAKLTQVCCVPKKEPAGGVTNQCRQLVSVEVNGRKVEALLDTGSDQTLIQPRYLQPSQVSISEAVSIRCVHGDEKRLPTADVYIKVRDHTYLLTVGVAENLPFQAILGRDIPVLLDLLQPSVCSNAAITRSQAKMTEDISPSLSALPFFDADMEVLPGKLRKSRRQRRCEKFAGTPVKSMVEGVPETPLDLQLPTDIGKKQREDPGLRKIFQQVESGENQDEAAGGERYVLKQEVLYRRQGGIERLVVPKEVRQLVLTLGHAIPWAGHLGRQKTRARIGKYFFWPGMRADVNQFCRSCPECQKTTLRAPCKVPLQPLPIIHTPFERLGMDIVGPVEKSKSGNRFMLVVTDYATKYPEVFPLKSVKARHVAFCLVQLFSRVGFPREILTDQGTNFMSKLLKQVYQLLGIRSLRTTPYHPQTDGLTERFNQTLKQMLRKFVDDTGSDWDQWLPFLLFAYREVPQASTGFSPFELLYGYEVRGPLSLLKEIWEGKEGREEPVNVAAYVLQMRERLQKMSTLAQEHMAQAQRGQKAWYDRSARQRNFAPGHKVLVMLPSHESKLLAKWQGPYEVQEKIGPTTYRVLVPGQRRSSRVLHVNLLKEWVSRPGNEAETMYVRRVIEEDDDEEQYLPKMAPLDLEFQHLSEDQQTEVRALCDPDVFSEVPGLTHVVAHDIVLKEDASVRRMSYRVPERLLGPLKEEVDQMLSLGIIEPSKSEWCHPVVLVPKKDGSIRFCIDFRYLNSVSKFDSYPTPRIDELIDRLGKARYLTTIDLCKGYWQIALTERSCELTAFRTPWGLFQFKVLPFGLHGAPASFQRLMDQVLCGLSEFAGAYLDDVVIYSTSWAQHLEHLQVVFQRLQEAGLTINPGKCAFAKAEIEYLGFVIGNGQVKPQVAKVQAIQNCPLPQTRKQLRSFLGMAGFYNRFIPNFSSRAAVLTDMVGSRCPNQVQWTTEAEAAFRDLQQALSKEPVLFSPDFDQDFVLQTDASERGLGAVLLQGPVGGRRPVAFISRKLFPRESRYSTIEKECLAVKWALDSLRYYLLGRQFTLETDHKALAWMQRMKDTNSRVTRWYLAMQPFHFTICHVPGRDNVTADYLSRCPGPGLEGGEDVTAGSATAHLLRW